MGVGTQLHSFHRGGTEMVCFQPLDSNHGTPPTDPIICDGQVDVGSYDGELASKLSGTCHDSRDKLVRATAVRNVRSKMRIAWRMQHAAPRCNAPSGLSSHVWSHAKFARYICKFAVGTPTHEAILLSTWTPTHPNELHVIEDSIDAKMVEDIMAEATDCYPKNAKMLKKWMAEKLQPL
ncbi:unnamed protein product, partial [Mesorhabditis spiculigera]